MCSCSIKVFLEQLVFLLGNVNLIPGVLLVVSPSRWPCAHTDPVWPWWCWVTSWKWWPPLASSLSNRWYRLFPAHVGLAWGNQLKTSSPNGPQSHKHVNSSSAGRAAAAGRCHWFVCDLRVKMSDRFLESSSFKSWFDNKPHVTLSV